MLCAPFQACINLIAFKIYNTSVTIVTSKKCWQLYKAQSFNTKVIYINSRSDDYSLMWKQAADKVNVNMKNFWVMNWMDELTA